MTVVNTVPLYEQQVPLVVTSSLTVVPPTTDHGSQYGTSAFHPYMNLQNHYYGIPQSMPIARTNPAVKKTVRPYIQGRDGTGSTYRLNDEALRQYSLGAYVSNWQGSYFKSFQQIARGGL